MKTCPQCHTDNPDDVKFCGECGTRLPERATAMSSPSVSVGDKNTIAGDLVGHQELYRISGNATIVKNEDETKKVVKCHCCGRNLSVAETYECPECGQVTCPDCYDREHGLCNICYSEKKGNKENVFRQTMARILEDGRVDLAERRDLEALKRQLGLSDERADSIEREMKAERREGSSGVFGDVPLSTIEQISFEKAFSAYHDEANPRKALQLVRPVHEKHRLNEEVLALYLFALSKVDEESARREIAALKADILGPKLALFDILLKHGEMNEAESLLVSVERMWPKEVLVEVRRILFLDRLSVLASEPAFAEEAKKRVAALPTPAGMERTSWVYRAQHAVVEQDSDAVSSCLTPAECKERGLSYAIASGVMDRPFRTYRVEIRGKAGSILQAVLPAETKQCWEVASGVEFKEAVRRYVAGEWRADGIPPSRRIPFVAGRFNESKDRCEGVFLHGEAFTDASTSLVIVDERGREMAFNADQTVARLKGDETAEFCQPVDGLGTLVVVSLKSVCSLAFKLRTDEPIDPGSFELHFRTISVLNERRRKIDLRMVDGVSFRGEGLLRSGDDESQPSETVSSVFWWTDSVDSDAESKAAEAFLQKNPMVLASVDRWNQAFAQTTPEQFLSHAEADSDDDESSVFSDDETGDDGSTDDKDSESGLDTLPLTQGTPGEVLIVAHLAGSDDQKQKLAQHGIDLMATIVIKKVMPIQQRIEVVLGEKTMSLPFSLAETIVCVSASKWFAKSSQDKATETGESGERNPIQNLFESDLDSAFLFQAVAQGDLRSLRLAAKGAFILQALGDRNGDVAGGVKVSPASVWNEVSFESLLRKAALRGDAESQFILGWWMEQDGKTDESAEWFRDAASNPASLNEGARAYARAKSEVCSDRRESALLFMKVWKSIYGKTGVFAKLVSFGWGARFDHLDANGRSRRVYCWCAMSTRAVQETILRTVRQSLEALVSDGQYDSRSAELLGEVEFNLSEYVSGQERIDLLRSAERRGNKNAVDALPKALFERGMELKASSEWQDALECLSEAHHRGHDARSEIADTKISFGKDLLDSDPQRALECFLSAEKNGSTNVSENVAEAERRTGEMYLKSSGSINVNGEDGKIRTVEKKDRGFSLLVDSAEKGNSRAMMDLYEYFKQGKSVSANKGEAKRWLKQAAKAGDEMALKITNRPKLFLTISVLALLALSTIGLVGWAFWTHPYWSFTILSFLLFSCIAIFREHKIAIPLMLAGGLSLAVPILRYPVKFACSYPFLGVPLVILVAAGWCVVIGFIVAGIIDS